MLPSTNHPIDDTELINEIRKAAKNPCLQRSGKSKLSPSCILGKQKVIPEPRNKLRNL